MVLISDEGKASLVWFVTRIGKGSPSSRFANIFQLCFLVSLSGLTLVIIEDFYIHVFTPPFSVYFFCLTTIQRVGQFDRNQPYQTDIVCDFPYCCYFIFVFNCIGGFIFV